MSNERLEVKQLTLDFDTKERVVQANHVLSNLSLIVNNNTSDIPPTVSVLNPNSPEITWIIRKLGKTLNW